jgi:hypothetical protein
VRRAALAAALLVASFGIGRTSGGAAEAESSAAAPPQIQKVPVRVLQREVRVRTELKVLTKPKPVPSRAVPKAGGKIVNYAPGCKLRSGAAASLRFIEAIVGRQIQTVSCWRSNAQQWSLYRSKPHLAAYPGTSLHEKGLAIDVNTNFLRRFPRVRTLLHQFGWAQFAPSWEPWHFSYRTVG